MRSVSCTFNLTLIGFQSEKFDLFKQNYIYVDNNKFVNNKTGGGDGKDDNDDESVYDDDKMMMRF